MKFNVLPTIFEHNTLHECEIKKAREIERATKAYHDDKKSTKGLPFFKRVSIFFKGMISAPVNAALESDTLYGGYVGFGSAIIGTLSVVGLDIGVAIFASYVVNNAGMEGIVRLLAVIGTLIGTIIAASPAALLSGSILGAIAGASIAICLTPLGLPIFYVLRKRHKKRLEELQAFELQEIADLKANIEKQFNEEAAERIRRYKEGFEKRIVEMSNSYNDSDVVTTIAELLEQNIVGTIKAKDRGITVETIDVVCSIEFSTKGVGRNCSLFCFEKERVEDLPSVIHATALAYTIMNKLLKLLNSRFSEKAIDSGFCLDGQIGYTQSGTVPALVIYYKAPNANYQPARQW